MRWTDQFDLLLFNTLDRNFGLPIEVTFVHVVCVGMISVTRADLLAVGIGLCLTHLWFSS